MYKPKESLRWRPKVALPCKLEDLCLNAVIDLVQKTSERMKRNSRDKKVVRDFLTKNVPKSIQQKVMQQAVERLVGVQTTLNILDLFEPRFVAQTQIDLLGPFRMGFGSYEKDNRLTWSQGSAKKYNLNENQLEQLYNFMIWADPTKLKEVSFSVARDTIKNSKMPNLLARARSLTRVTILSGAENHTLRVLGVHCPCLTHLDISHSIRVTDQGLQSLLLKRIPRKKKKNSQASTTEQPIPRGDLMAASSSSFRIDESMDVDEIAAETNSCAKTLVCITLLGTSVTWEGCDSASKLMDFGYLHSFLPVVKILRIGKDCLREKGVQISDRPVEQVALHPFLDFVFTCAQHALPLDDLSKIVMDHYKPRRFEGSERLSDENKSLIFLRNAKSFKLMLHMKIDSSKVTSLVLPWYTFTWRLDNIMDLDTAGLHFPNLKFLRARIKGTWHYTHQPLFPVLEEAHVWSLNSATGLSILENAPILKCFEFNNTQTLVELLDEEEINDETLEESFYKNPNLAKTLEEITIRPAELTLTSLYNLVTLCRNLKRIGDMESWDVTAEEIRHFNRFLDDVACQCVVTVMNFPPTYKDKFEFI